MNDDNAFKSEDPISEKAYIANKIKEFFQFHDIDKMTKKYSDDLRLIGNLDNKLKQHFQQNKMLLEISQHNCRKCQMRMLEEMNQIRSKTPTKLMGLSKPDHNHSLHYIGNQNRSMTPELNIKGSRIGVVGVQKKKIKGSVISNSPGKKPKSKAVYTPSRTKSPSNLASTNPKKNINKSPTVITPKYTNRNNNKLNLQTKVKGQLTPSKTNRIVTPKHSRMMTSYSKEKSKSKDKIDIKKHSRLNISVSNEKSKNKIDIKKPSRFNKSVSNEKSNEKSKDKSKETNKKKTIAQSQMAKSTLSPTIKKNIKTPVVGKNKLKPSGKLNDSDISARAIKNEDVIHSINEINKTVKGLKESIRLIDNNDEETLKKTPPRTKNQKKKLEETSDDNDNENDNDDDDENSIRLEKQLLKREKEKRIMDKLRNEKNKITNRGQSPDFNTKNKGLVVCSKNLQISSIQKDVNNSPDLASQKREIYKSTKYEISSNQKNQILGTSNIHITNQKREIKSNFNKDQEKTDNIDKSPKRRGKDQEKTDNIDKSPKKSGKDQEKTDNIDKSPKKRDKEHQKFDDDKSSKTKGKDHDKFDDDKSSKTKGKDHDKFDDDQSSKTKGRDLCVEKGRNKKMDKVGDKYEDDKKKFNSQTDSLNNSTTSFGKDKEKEFENESDLMKEKREKIREKVMEKRKEKEKSKEKILKEKNTSMHSLNDSNLSPQLEKELKDRSKGNGKTDKREHANQHHKTAKNNENRLLKLLVITLNSGFIDINTKISIITSSPQLLPAFHTKNLIVEKISSLMKESSKIKTFLSKYDLFMFTRPFSLTKIAASSVSLITKEDELSLCKIPQPREILSLFTVLYIILDEKHYEVPTKDLVVNLVKVLLKKYQVDSIKSLLLNIIPQKSSISDTQMDLLFEVKESSPNFLNSNELEKISKAASYISFVIQEFYDYAFVQYNDGTTLYEVKKAVKAEQLLQNKILELQKYL